MSSSFDTASIAAGQAAQQAGDVAIARVHVRRDLLQEDDQECLKAGQLGECSRRTVSPAVDGLPARLLNRHVAIEVIDERAVERLLLFEERRDDPADGGREAAADTRFRRRRRESSRAC